MNLSSSHTCHRSIHLFFHVLVTLIITSANSRRISIKWCMWVVEHVWNVMAHAQKPDLVFRRNGRIHLNWRRGQFSRLLAAEVCASAVVMLDTPCSDVEYKSTGYPLHSHVSPSLPLPCVTVCHQVSTELYHESNATYVYNYISWPVKLIRKHSYLNFQQNIQKPPQGSIISRRWYYRVFFTPYHSATLKVISFFGQSQLSQSPADVISVLKKESATSLRSATDRLQNYTVRLQTRPQS